MKQSLSLLIILLLCACGFHLRGQPYLLTTGKQPSLCPIAVLMPQQEDVELMALLPQQLQAQQLETTPSLKQACHLLIIDEAYFHTEIKSIAASTVPRQYLLTYKLAFHFSHQNGTLLLPKRTLQVSRPFTANNNRVLGSDFEQSVIKNEMRQEAIQQIILWLNTLPH